MQSQITYNTINSTVVCTLNKTDVSKCKIQLIKVQRQYIWIAFVCSYFHSNCAFSFVKQD